MNKRKDNGSSSGLVVAGIVMLLGILISNFGALLDGIGDGEVLGGIFGLIVLMILAVLRAVLKNKKKSSQGSGSFAAPRASNNPYARENFGKTKGATVSFGQKDEHCHDRLHGADMESPEEHWKRQLDGFLAAGIIDRKEYRTLLERRKTNYREK